MGSKQRRKKKARVLIDEEIAANKENEAQRQRERRQRIRGLNNVSKEKDIEDTMMDEEVKEENPIQENSGAHSNYAFNIGVSPNSRIFSRDEIGDFLEAGYDLNDLDFLHEKQLSNDHAQNTPIEMPAPKEMPRKFEGLETLVLNA